MRRIKTEHPFLYRQAQAERKREWMSWGSEEGKAFGYHPAHEAQSGVKQLVHSVCLSTDVSLWSRNSFISIMFYISNTVGHKPPCWHFQKPPVWQDLDNTAPYREWLNVLFGAISINKLIIIKNRMQFSIILTNEVCRSCSQCWEISRFRQNRSS